MAGLVYSYRDDKNFNEIVISALGVIELREIRNGLSKTTATDAYEESGVDRWVDIELRRAGGRSTVFVNGEALFEDVLQSSTRWSRASFDDISWTNGPP